MPSMIRQSKLKQLEDLKRRMNKKPMNGPSKLRPQIKGKPKTSVGEPLRKPRDPKGTGPIRPTFIKKLDALKRRKPMSS